MLQDSRQSQQSGYVSQSEMSDAGTGHDRPPRDTKRPRERRGASSLVHRSCRASPLSGERIVNNYQGIVIVIIFIVVITVIIIVIIIIITIIMILIIIIIISCSCYYHGS